MNLLRVSFTAATHKTSFNTLICAMCKADGLSRAAQLLDHVRREKESITNETTTYRVFNQMILNGYSPSSAVTLNDVLRRGDCVNYNTFISDMSKAEELTHAVSLLDHMRLVKGLTPNETTYTSLIHSLCKHDDRIDDAYKVLNEMILSGFYPSVDTANDVLRGCLRIGEIGKAYEMYNEHTFNGPIVKQWWMDEDSHSLLEQAFSDGVTYTSLMNAYLDEGKLFHVDKLRFDMRRLFHVNCFPDSVNNSVPDSVQNSVFINGLDNKARTTNTKKYLLRFNYDYSLCLHMSTLEYRRTLAVNYSDDEFKSLVELVEGFCKKGDTMLKWDNKLDEIVYNLFIIEHCKCSNVYQAYHMYKEMVHYGFACHMFTVFALIKTLKGEAMFNELRCVVQNVLRSCNLNDFEILKFLNEFNPNKPNSEALFNVLAEKANDGLFLKCSNAPARA